MTKINGFRLRINGIEKYQQRTGGYKKCWWFSFSNNFFDDEEMGELTNDEKLVFIYILCEASKQQKKEVFISLKFMQQKIDVKKEVILSAVDKLHYFQIVTPIKSKSVQSLSRICKQSGADLFGTEQNRTEEKRKEKNIYAHQDERVSSFKFSDWVWVYDEYPKKIGKKKGLEKLKRIMKTEQIAHKYYDAQCNYIRYVEEIRLDNQFIKQFDTFVNSWEDWEKSDQEIEEMIKSDRRK
jgi:hypothetical protein